MCVRFFVVGQFVEAALIFDVIRPKVLPVLVRIFNKLSLHRAYFAKK